jgi:hypothetical protein
MLAGDIRESIPALQQKVKIKGWGTKPIESENDRNVSISCLQSLLDGSILPFCHFAICGPAAGNDATAVWLVGSWAGGLATQVGT